MLNKSNGLEDPSNNSIGINFRSLLILACSISSDRRLSSGVSSPPDWVRVKFLTRDRSSFNFDNFEDSSKESSSTTLFFFRFEGRDPVDSSYSDLFSFYEDSYTSVRYSHVVHPSDTFTNSRCSFIISFFLLIFFVSILCSFLVIQAPHLLPPDSVDLNPCLFPHYSFIGAFATSLNVTWCRLTKLFFQMLFRIVFCYGP